MALLRDLSYSLKSLRKAPGFSLVVIATLALGIGATTSVFSVIDVLLLRPLPYPDPQNLLRLYETKTANDPATESDLAPANFVDWQEQSRTFAGIAASSGFRYVLTGNQQPEMVWGGAVSASWFQVLGVHPSLGRDFVVTDDNSGAAPTVLISEKLWRRKYQGDSSLVGKTIGINGTSFTVIGVMPEKADFNPYAQLWIPLRKQVRPDRMLWRDSRFIQTIGRIKPGVTRIQATDDLNSIASLIRKEHPSGDVYGGAALENLQQTLNGDTQRILIIAFAVVGLVLLVACANVTNLMLLRVASRSRELAIRLALGARPSILIRQLLVEGLLLGVAAGLLGLAIGEAGKRLVLWQIQWTNPDLAVTNLSWPVLLFAFGTAVIAGVGFALVPAFTVVRAGTHDLLGRASAANSTVDRRGHRLRQGLVIAEIACSMVLLTGAGLVMRSFQTLEQVPLGFATDHRIQVDVTLPRTRYQNDADVARFYQQVADRVRSQPGVLDATFTYLLPMNDGGDFGVGFQIVDQKADPDVFYGASLRLADSHTLSTLAVPLLRGRFFDDADSIHAEQVCVVSRAFAQKYWPGQDPIGKLIRLDRRDIDGERKPRRVVGVAADVRNHIYEESQPAVYVPFTQIAFFHMEMLIFTHDSIEATRKTVSAVLQSVDSDQPIRGLENFADRLPNALADWRTAILLLGGLASVAALLTVLGVFAVVAYMVREKTREIGIRMAIGATRENIRKLVLSQGMRLALAGIIVGGAASFACTRSLGSLIYGVSPFDPATLAIVVCFLGVLALVASYIPARRAMRVDPMQTIRAE